MVETSLFGCIYRVSVVLVVVIHPSTKQHTSLLSLISVLAFSFYSLHGNIMQYE